MGRQTAGFTMLELTQVVAIIGIMATASIPLFTRTIMQARTAQAPVLLHAIAHRIHVAREEGLALTACGPTPSELPTSKGATFVADACWRSLGFTPKSAVYYQLEMTFDEQRRPLVTARSDLDEDGEIAEWILDVDRAVLREPKGQF